MSKNRNRSRSPSNPSLSKRIVPGSVLAAQKELQALIEQEIQKAMEVNAIYGALQHARRVHGEILNQTAPATISVIGISGKPERLDLAGFERDAQNQIEQQKQEPPADGDMIPKGQSLYD